MDRIRRLLFEAAQTGNLEAFYGLLEEDPFIVDTIFWVDAEDTPLHVAALNGKTDFVKEMIRRCPDFATKLNREGTYPIHLASANGHVEIVKELCLLNQVGSTAGLCFMMDSQGKTPLDYAVMKGRKDVIHVLLSAAYSYYVYDPGYFASLIEKVRDLALQAQLEALRVVEMWYYVEPFRISVIKRKNKKMDGTSTTNLRVLNTLLAGVAQIGDPLMKELFDEDPLILEKLCSGSYLEAQLHIIVFAGQTEDSAKEIIRRRLEFSKILNDYRWFSPIHMASQYGYVEIVKLLLTQVGSGLCFVKDAMGRTPLHWASNVEIVKLLLTEAGSDLCFVKDTEGRTPLHCAHNVEIVKLLLTQAGSGLCFVKDTQGRTPLHRAHNVEIVKLLLTQAGSDLCFVKDTQGRTPLHCAVDRYFVREETILCELLSACWECVREVTTKNETVLHLALKNNQLKAFKILLERHIKDELLNTKDWDGNSTSINGYVELVKMLLSEDGCNVCLLKDMDMDMEDEGGRRTTTTPLYYAVIKCTTNKDYNINILHQLFSDDYPKFIREVTAQNQTVLHLSVKRNYSLTLKVLLRSPMVREILDVKDDDGNTVFDLLIPREETVTNFMGTVISKNYQMYEDVIWFLDAVKMDDLGAFNELVDEDPLILAKVSLFPFGGTPLHIAVEYWSDGGKLTDCVKEIIRRWPHFAKQYNEEGEAPIHIASSRGYVEIVKELLTEVGSSLCLLKDCPHGLTALHCAVENGYVDITNELLSACPKCLHEITTDGYTALQFAVLHGYSETTKILVERHVEDELLNPKEDWDGNSSSVLDLVKGYVEIIKELLRPQQVGSSLCILVGKTEPDLHHEYFAVIKGTISKDNIIIHELLSAYPEYIREVTAQGKTVLHLSVDEKSTVTLKVLLRNPIFYNKHKYGYTVIDRLMQCYEDIEENEMGKLFTIWENTEKESSEDATDDDDDDDDELLEGVAHDSERKLRTKEGDRDDVDGGNPSNEILEVENDYTGVLQLPEGAKCDNEELPEDAQNNSAEQPPEAAKDDNEKLPENGGRLPNEVVGDYVDGGVSILNQDSFRIQVGETFRSATIFRDIIKSASIRAHYGLKFDKSEKKRIVAKCSEEGCKWRIYATAKQDSDSFIVKTLTDNHTCQRSKESAKKLATPKWVSNRIIDEIRKDPTFQPEDIRTFILQSHYQINIEYMTAWRAKEKALERIHGSFTESYKKLRDYVDSVLQSNPESMAILLISEEKTFDRLFISYNACLNGFSNGCAPLVFIEKTPIKQGYGGFILSAIGVDGNNELFPISFAIVDIDSKSTWEWFFHQLKSVVDRQRGYNQMTIISNRVYGLREATKDYFPEAVHGHCTWHLAQNMQKKFGHKIVDLCFWQIAKALTNEQYDQAFEHLKGRNEAAADWIEENHPENWAASKFEGDTYRHITSNMTETFNEWIEPARYLPILAMLEQIRVNLMVLFRERRKVAFNSSSCLTEHAERLIEEADKASKSYYVCGASDSIFEVRDDNKLGFRVDLSNKSCTCLFWQKVGIPCSHALAAIKNAKISPPYLEYCNAYYTTQVYGLAYQDIIEPVLPKNHIGGFVITEDILPPNKKTRPAAVRPNLKRKRPESTKEKRVMHCSICKGSGHTKKSCRSRL